MRPSYFALKIHDGLFIGDRHSPNQLDFLLSNSITTIINCAAREIQINQRLVTNIRSFNWMDNQKQIILDPSDTQFNSIYNFIEEARNKFEGILICSVRCQSRALTILISYLLKKYKWTLYKTLEYINSKRNDFEIRANFLKQLVALESRLYGPDMKGCTKNWSEKQLELQGEIIRNTYLNSLRNEATEQKQKKWKKQSKKAVKIIDKVIVIGNPKIKQEQKQDLLIIQLDKVIEKKLKTQLTTQEISRKRKIKLLRARTQYQQDECEFPLKKIVQDQSIIKQKRVLNRQTRNSSEKKERHSTEPKQKLHVNINFNINSINIISGIEQHQQKVLKNNYTTQKSQYSRRYNNSIINHTEKKSNLNSTFHNQQKNMRLIKKISFDQFDQYRSTKFKRRQSSR